MGPTYAGWEDDFPVFCADHNLPEPILSTVVCGHLVDALFPAARVIVELDGWRFHNDRTSFEADRDRDADTLAGGYATVRITWRRIERQPQREAARLQTILDRRLVVPS